MSVLVGFVGGISPPDIQKSAPDYSAKWLENRRSRLGALAASLADYQLPIVASKERRGPVALEGIGFLVLESDEFDIARIGNLESVRVVDDKLLTQQPVVTASASSGGSWHLEKISHSSLPAGVDGAGVVIGVVETGIDDGYHEFANQPAGWLTCVDSSVDPPAALPLPTDPLNHGTLVCSLLVGELSGVARAARLAVASVCDNAFETTRIRLAYAWDWLIKTDLGRANGLCGCDVLNLSLAISEAGGDPEHFAYDELLRVQKDLNTVVVAAAGRFGPKPNTAQSPANYDFVVAVGATTKNDKIAESSGWAAAYKDGSNCPDLSAPGVSVVFPNADGTSFVSSGTSFATPLVSAAAALVIQHERNSGNPLVTVDRVKERLRRMTRTVAGIQFVKKPTLAQLASRGGAGILDLSKLESSATP